MTQMRISHADCPEFDLSRAQIRKAPRAGGSPRHGVDAGRPVHAFLREGAVSRALTSLVPEAKWFRAEIGFRPQIFDSEKDFCRESRQRWCDRADSRGRPGMRRNVNVRGQHCAACGTAAPSQSRQSDICMPKAANEAGCAESPAPKKTAESAFGRHRLFPAAAFFGGSNLLGLLRHVAPRLGPCINQTRRQHGGNA